MHRERRIKTVYCGERETKIGHVKNVNVFQEKMKTNH